MSVALPEYTIRPARVDDAQAYGRLHVAALAQTYAHLMPPEFHQIYESRLDEVIERHRQRIEQEGRGDSPDRSWVARDADGRVVGIAAAGPPRDAAWQQDAPRPTLDLELHHIYTLSATHGSGLGQRLLNAAIDGRAAFLWILRNNPRAERFYRRNGFAPDGVTLLCGPSWYNKPMFRMHRGSAAP